VAHDNVRSHLRFADRRHWGLIGLGGGEFGLPILVGLIGFAPRAAVPMNQILSLVTLVTALVVRWYTGSLAGVGVFRPCRNCARVWRHHSRVVRRASAVARLRSSPRARDRRPAPGNRSAADR